MRTAMKSLVILLPLIGCDPDDAGRPRQAEKVAARPGTPPASAPTGDRKVAATPGETKAVEARPAVEEVRTDVTGDRKGLVTCLSACDEQKSSPTDKATCRMNCDSVHNLPATTVAAGAADGGVEKAVACISTCHEAGTGDSAACVQACKIEAGKAVNAPAAGTLDQLGTCLGNCYGNKRLKETDRETCKLNCEQIASVAGPGDSKPGSGT